VPLVCMAAAYSVHVSRLGLPLLVVAAIAGVGPVMFVRVFRTGTAEAHELSSFSSVAGAFDSMGLGVSDELQTYAQAPQFVGFMLERAESGASPLMVVNSVLSPVPLVGKSFREMSGTAFYNRQIYGSGASDQIAPLEGELYLSLGLPGLCLVFVFIGAALSRLNRAFLAAASPFDSYAAMFVSVWMAYAVQGGIASIAQTLLYFGPPLMVYRWGSHGGRARNAGSNGPRWVRRVGCGKASECDNR